MNFDVIVVLSGKRFPNATKERRGSIPNQAAPGRWRAYASPLRSCVYR